MYSKKKMLVRSKTLVPNKKIFDRIKKFLAEDFFVREIFTTIRKKVKIFETKIQKVYL